MKAKKFLNIVLTCLWVSAWPSLVPLATAAFDSGSTGADGAFNPTTNTALQIPESGVFNFTTVNIPSGVTVTFKKNTQNTPVTILASGDVLVNGTISVNGGNGNYIIPGAGGPGGFDGGVGGTVPQAGRKGEGPGGGSGGSPKTNDSKAGGSGGGGSYGSNGGSGATYYSDAPGGAGGTGYGNERILPILGGSGGGGGGGTNSYVGGAGGGGGGAILIASSGTISISGSITANGGNGATPESYYGGGGGGGGSGGSIRLVANTITGNGSITSTGGSGGTIGWTGGSGGSGGLGRIRLEASSITRTSATNPPFSMGYAYAVTPPNMPALAITSIGGIDVPAVPKGGFGAPDIMLPFNTKNPITVVVTGTNIPTGTTVTVKTSPAVGNAASATATLSGTESSSTASVSLNISTAYPSLITASVTYQVTASNGGPIYAEGEKVEWVRVAGNLGGESSVTYITESGREILVKM